MKWVQTDGGRGFEGITRTKRSRDCVTRALAIAMARPYSQVAMDMLHLCQIDNDRGIATGNKALQRAHPDRGVFTNTPHFKDYLASWGWVWTPTMAIGSGCKVHLRDGELPMGRLIVKVSRHLVAVIDGVIYDSHDPSRWGNRCVYGYWSPRSVE